MYALLPGTGVRFVAAGALNTVLTFLLYQVLILFAVYPLAYSISFVAGIVFAANVYARTVFKVELRPKTATCFAIFYIASYLVGLGLLVFVVDYLSTPKWLAPVFVMMVMVPLNFFGSRLTLDGP